MAKSDPGTICEECRQAMSIPLSPCVDVFDQETAMAVPSDFWRLVMYFCLFWPTQRRQRGVIPRRAKDSTCGSLSVDAEVGGEQQRSEVRPSD